MARARSAPVGSATQSDSALERSAKRLADSLDSGPPFELEPDLERALRGLILARTGRSQRAWRARGFGLDAEDVVQRVFEKLLSSRPQFEGQRPVLPQLLTWVRVVTQNYLADLAVKSGESFDERAVQRSHLRLDRPVQWAEEERLHARRILEDAALLVQREYPRARPLFELLLRAPHTTSRELARALRTTPQNVDQMRTRLRRLLRGHLSESVEGGVIPRVRKGEP